MTGSPRSAVPGQLSLLKLLEKPIDLDVSNVSNIPDEPNEPDAPNDPGGDAARPASEVELGEWERAVLRFAAEHHLAGRYDQRVQQDLGCSATRYLQALSGMLDRPEVLTAEPELVGRLRALRDRRQQLRTLARGGLPPQEESLGAAWDRRGAAAPPATCGPLAGGGPRS